MENGLKMSEGDLKRKCVAFLKKNYPGMWFYCPADRFRSGIPDILMCSEGDLMWAELKDKRGRVSAIQEWTHHLLKSAGAAGCVIRSLEEFKEFLFSRAVK